MKVILLQDVAGQGKRGQVINVAEGYARNYLIPRGMAGEASHGKLRELEDRKKADAAKERKQEQAARELAERLHHLTVVVKTKSGEAGKLFGSVNNKDVAEGLEEQHKISIDKKKMVIKEPIKQLGSYPVTIKLHSAVQAEIIVEVQAE
ncbi:MAG: 50S ribosomal protein L9 [Peptococcaceae bacterium]|nr:50S ribosomal protein L9 [Peptococcaceae bacterium]